mmetsp:Transcript_26751/g.52512  ORF Transcript_26751/g.52512 Transcript_26751/m.52512 type:complete len:108 (+) Transcript_26751:459-782(+)
MSGWFKVGLRHKEGGKERKKVEKREATGVPTPFSYSFESDLLIEHLPGQPDLIEQDRCRQRERDRQAGRLAERSCPEAEKRSEVTIADFLPSVSFVPPSCLRSLRLP